VISFGTNSVTMSQSFGIVFGTASVAILHSFSMDQARLMCHLSGAFTGLLDVHHMLGELIVLDRGVCSLALLRVCLSIHLDVCLPSLDFVHLSSFSESTSRFMSRCACRCYPSQLVTGSYGTSFLYFPDGNCLR
jgi:hypothetical protein